MSVKWGKRFCLVSHLESLQIRWLQSFIMQGIYQDKCFQLSLKDHYSHPLLSFVRCFPFCSKQGANLFSCLKIQINKKTNINMNFVYLTIKLVKYMYYPFCFVLNHLKDICSKKSAFCICLLQTEYLLENTSISPWCHRECIYFGYACQFDMINFVLISS